VGYGSVAVVSLSVSGTPKVVHLSFFFSFNPNDGLPKAPLLMMHQEGAEYSSCDVVHSNDWALAAPSGRADVFVLISCFTGAAAK
jgi:hypothetical protein